MSRAVGRARSSGPAVVRSRRPACTGPSSISASTRLEAPRFDGLWRRHERGWSPCLRFWMLVR